MNNAINKVTEYKENQKKEKEEAQKKEYEMKQRIKEEGIEKIVNEFFANISGLSARDIELILSNNKLGEATSKVAKILEEKGIVKIFTHSSDYDDFENDSGFVNSETYYTVDYKKLREVFPFSSSNEVQIEKENKTIKAYAVKDNKDATVKLVKKLKKSNKREFVDIKNEADVDLVIYEKILNFSHEHTTHYLDKDLNIWFTYDSYDNGSSCSFIKFDTLSQENQELIKQFSVYQSEIKELKRIAREQKAKEDEEKRIKYEQEKKEKELERLRQEDELKKKKQEEKILKDSKLNDKLKYETEHLKKRSNDEIKSYLLSTHKSFKIDYIEIKTFVEGASIVYAVLNCAKNKQKYVYFENFNEDILINFAKENNIEI